MSNAASQSTLIAQPQLNVFPPRNSFAARWVSRWIDHPDDLEALRPGWEALVRQALWPNPSMAPHYLLPAWKHLADRTVRVLIVEEFVGSRAPRLVGLVPFVETRVYRLPFTALQIWNHEQCFDATPLLCAEHATEVWTAVCESLSQQGVSLLSLETVSAEPGFQDVFSEVNQSQAYTCFQRDLFERAAFVPAGSTEAYLSEHVSTSFQKKMRRLGRKLSELGEVQFLLSDETSDFDQLANDFLRIEASGWKGDNGTALASQPASEAFYRELIAESAKSGGARFLTLTVDNRPIAMLSDIQTDDIVYSYKTAFDDEFSKFSPGVQLELKNLEFFHEQGVALADSCTASDNGTINRIWGQKLKFQSAVLSLQPGLPSLATKSLPWLQTLARKLKRK